MNSTRKAIAAVIAFLIADMPLQAAELEEIVVTAQKRAESVQDVPIAMVAYGGEQIQELAIGDLRQLIEYVPGVELFDDRGVSSQPTWVIRGVGLADFNANNTPTAAIYYDEFYLTSNIMGGIGMFDIDRIEVLKGPQGGLYGRNTTGGAVRVESAKPSLEESSGYVSASYGRYDATALEGAVGGPFSDNVAFRIAAMTNQGGGYQDSLATASDDEWGDADFWAVRAQLLFEPSDNVSILLKVEGGADNSETPLGHGIGAYDAVGDLCPAILAGSQDDQTCIHWANLTNLVIAAPIGPLPSDQSGDGKVVLASPINELDNEWLSATARIDWDLENVTFTSITGFIDYENRQAFDYEGGFLDTGHEFNKSPVEAWSQEFRLTSDASGPFTWLAGIMYAEDELNEFRTFTFPDNILIFGGLPSSDRGYDQETTSWSVYAQVGFQISDQWNIHGSLRFTDEDKELRGGFTSLNVAPGVPGESPGTPLPAPLGGPVDGYFIFGVNRDYELDENWSGHIGIDWTPTDNALWYAKISRGVKSGGFFGGFSLSDPELDPYIEETVLAYEVGFKSDWVDNTFRLNGAAYYYDYSDVQGFLTVFSTVTNTALTKLGNIGDAEHTGFELDFAWLPRGAEGLSLSGGIAWLDAELESSNTFVAQDFVTEVSYDGLERPYAPDLSYFIQGRYEWPIGERLMGMVQLNYSWRDDQLNADTTGTLIDGALFGIPDYGIVNARAQVGDSDGRWNVAVFGKNVSDEAYLANNTFDNLGGYLQTYGRPASWGIEFNYNWQ
jgi:iron complex outermembrane receptor protein